MGVKVLALEEARAKGLKFYFTGIPCRHGHVAPRRVLDRGCTACRRRIDRKNYYAHQAKKIAKSSRWNKANPDRVKAWIVANPESYKKSQKKWCTANREHLNARQRDYCKKNRSQINGYSRKSYANNPQFKIRTALRSRLLQTVKHQRGVKSGKTLELLGCTLEQFKVHLERQFLPKMTWDNYGYGDGKWHIDHIRPVVVFDLTKAEEQRACFHFTNLRPLWQVDNFKKGDQLQELL